MMLITATTIGALYGQRHRSKCHRKQPVCAQYSPKVVRPKATRTHTLGAELPPAATPPDHAIESAPPAASWQDDFLHAVIPCLLPSAASASSGSAAACSTTASEDSSEEEDVDGVEDFGPAMQAPLAAARAATPTSVARPQYMCRTPTASGARRCAKGRRAPLAAHRIGTSGDAKGEDEPTPPSCETTRSASEPSRRTTPFGLVHDFRAVERLATLTPIVGASCPMRSPSQRAASYGGSACCTASRAMASASFWTRSSTSPRSGRPDFSTRMSFTKASHGPPHGTIRRRRGRMAGRRPPSRPQECMRDEMSAAQRPTNVYFVFFHE